MNAAKLKRYAREKIKQNILNRTFFPIHPSPFVTLLEVRLKINNKVQHSATHRNNRALKTNNKTVKNIQTPLH